MRFRLPLRTTSVYPGHRLDGYDGSFEALHCHPTTYEVGAILWMEPERPAEVVAIANGRIYWVWLKPARGARGAAP